MNQEGKAQAYRKYAHLDRSVWLPPVDTSRCLFEKYGAVFSTPLRFMRGFANLSAENERDDLNGDDNAGHDDRIVQLKDREQLLHNKEAHLKGEYEYQSKSMRDN